MLSPAERNEIIRSGIVTDLDEVPPAFLKRVRTNVRDHIAAGEPASTRAVSERRPVRVDTRFLEQLDAQMGEERYPNGGAVPCRLPPVRAPGDEDDFVLHFDELGEVILGRLDYRMVITAGRLVSGISIMGRNSWTARSSYSVSKPDLEGW